MFDFLQAHFPGVLVQLLIFGDKREHSDVRHERDIRIRQYGFVHIIPPCLSLTLQPRQMSALEDIRDGGDLDFELIIFGEGGEVE